MAIAINDILKLKNLQNFKLLAGGKGTNKIVTIVGILDYEFLDNNEPFKVEVFDKDSFVISSLLFARENKDLIFPAIEGLINSKVSGFAFKTVIFDELPQEVLDLANKHSFPIFSFNDTYMFENIIFEIMDAIKNNDSMWNIQKNINRMIEQSLTRSEVAVLTKDISSTFKQIAKAAYITNINKHYKTSIDRIMRRFYSNEQLTSKAAICSYKDDLIIIVTMNNFDETVFGIVIEEIINYCELRKVDISIGYSNVHGTYEGMDYCLKEAYYAHIVGQIEDSKTTAYENIGTYKFLIPEINLESITSFMSSYLDPIFNEEEQFKTAVQFVLSKGDIGETAKKLICHKNTVRYRINKLRETLDWEMSDSVFYENLSTSIKIYLLKQKLN